MSNLLAKLVGWKAAILHDDPTAYDRLEWLSNNLESGPLKTFDAGCGNGGFSFFAATKGNFVTGASFDEDANNRAQTMAQQTGITNTNFLELDLRTLATKTDELGSFDQIICFETIEHIANDDLLLKNLATMISPGGKLFLTTPYKHYRGLIGDKISQTEDGGHVRWGYTHDEITKLCTKHGLTVLKKEYVSGIISQQTTNLLRLLGKINKRFAWYATLPLRLLRPLDRPLSRLFNYPYLSIAVILQKH